MSDGKITIPTVAQCMRAIHRNVKELGGFAGEDVCIEAVIEDLLLRMKLLRDANKQLNKELSKLKKEVSDV